MTPVSPQSGAPANTLPGGHEPDRTHVLGSTAVLVGLVVLLGLTFVAVYAFWSDLRAQRAEGAAPPEFSASNEPPWRTRAWIAPAAELAALRARERAHLAGYRWLDGTHDRVQIPIDRAMELIVARQAAFGAAPPASAPSSAPTAAAGRGTAP
jgi:hypothetical protein